MKIITLLALIVAASGASVGTKAPLEEEFGYVDVRPGAHMFWAMYHVDQEGDYSTFPLILWLQGGPGGSGVGYGNFMELGPYDINGNLRPYAWTKKANLLFVDNPVGTGYSYVEDDTLYTKDNAEIAADLVTCMKEVFKTNPDMEKMPFYVFAESYGGKMTVDFALAFNEAIKNGEVTSDFRGVALGDSWISPMDSVNTWGDYLYWMGFVDRKGLNEIDDSAARAQAAVDAGNWEEATNMWGETEYVVMDVAHNVNFYNVLAVEDIYLTTAQKPHTRDGTFMSSQVRHLYQHHVLSKYGTTNDALSDFMNGPQAEHWNIPAEVVWHSNSDRVFDNLAGDFMKPVVDSVVKLLTETDINVSVYSGNLDLICDTPGTYKWIEDMEWPDKEAWTAAEVQPLYVTSYSSQAATVQYYNQLSVFTIFRSGHMVPTDAPEIALQMVDLITKYSSAVETQEKASDDTVPEAEVESSSAEEPIIEEKSVEDAAVADSNAPEVEEKSVEDAAVADSHVPEVEEPKPKPMPEAKPQLA